MSWYYYEITVGAKDRIINSVTAPMIPGINISYNPPKYDYTYLISPAATWSDFGKLDIYINTPYYLIYSNIDGFEKTENGYELHLDGLPREKDSYHLTLDGLIKEEGKVFGVVAVALYFGVHVRRVSVVRLAIASDTGADGEPLFPSIVEAFVIGGGEMWAWTYKAHVALQDVKYLG